MPKPTIAEPPKKNAAAIFRRTLTRISPKFSTRVIYLIKFKHPIQLKHPKTLNEKICWLKLNTYKNNSLVTQCADKYLVREYVDSKGLGDSLNDLIGAWDSVEQIPWQDLPEQYVLKCNHGCGYNILVPDKSQLTEKEAVEALSEWMKDDYWLGHAEPHYKNIPRKIVCEKYLGDEFGHQEKEYQFFCFNGVVKYILVLEFAPPDNKRNIYFFDRAWNLTRLTKDRSKTQQIALARPENLENMFLYAEKLAEPFPFVRVDTFLIGGKIIFGELTFTPTAGFYKSILPEADLEFGSLLNL